MFQIYGLDLTSKSELFPYTRLSSERAVSQGISWTVIGVPVPNPLLDLGFGNLSGRMSGGVEVPVVMTPPDSESRGLHLLRILFIPVAGFLLPPKQAGYPGLIIARTSATAFPLDPSRTLSRRRLARRWLWILSNTGKAPSSPSKGARKEEGGGSAISSRLLHVWH